MILKLIILGILKRSGELHGYKIKEKIEREVADFVNVKLSNVYYHLSNLHKKGYLDVEQINSQDNKSYKMIYKMNPMGISLYQELLRELLVYKENHYYHEDVIIYFANEYKTGELQTYFKEKNKRDKIHRQELMDHKNQIMDHIPAPYKDYAEAIMNHSLYHLEAEIKWNQSMEKLFLLCESFHQNL